MIRVQEADFDTGAELAALSAGRQDVGGVVSFVGLVRGGAVTAMTLEHYPGMTERALAGIEADARRRWDILDVLIVHRHGRLLPGQRIVLVAVSASHRQTAFAACEFLVDWLKTRAPFWKVEDHADGPRWVEARDVDDERAARWEGDGKPA